MIPPGMPVKSGHFTLKSQHARSGSAQAAPSPPRKKSSQQTLDINLNPHPNAPLRAQQTSKTEQIFLDSPRKQSPVGSMGSTVESRDSSQGPLWSRSMGSSESGALRSMEGYRSSEEPDLVTPKEQYIHQMPVNDEVESQFDNLLVSSLSLFESQDSDGLS